MTSLDARPLGLIDRFPRDWWWTFALDRCYPPQGRHVERHTCRARQRRPRKGGRRGMIADATYTGVCQQLAADVVYAMTYAEMDTWRNARSRL